MVPASELSEPTEWERIQSWYQCASRLLQISGRNEDYVHKLPSYYAANSVERDPEFLEYLMSVMFVESRFNRKALSSADAHGLMQITLPAIVDASAHCSLRPLRMHEKERLFDSGTNIRYGSCYLKKLLDDTGGDWVRALITYNGGYKQLFRFDAGLPIAAESANYVLQVTRARKVCTLTE